MTDFVIPHDEEGQVSPHDHPNFGPGHSLIRRISAEHIVPDNNRGCQRLSSAVYKFDNPADHLSCDSTTCIEARDANPVDWATTGGWLGALTVGTTTFRDEMGDIGVKIGMVPLDTNPCHGGIWAKITTGRANALLRASDWLVGISGVAKSKNDEPFQA